MPVTECSKNLGKEDCQKYKAMCHWSSSNKCNSWDRRCESLETNEECKLHTDCRWDRGACKYKAVNRRANKHTRSIMEDIYGKSSQVNPSPKIKMHRPSGIEPKMKLVKNDGHLDIYSKSEFPTLISSMDKTRERDFHRTFKIRDEKLKTMRYRQDTKESLIQGETPFSKINPRPQYSIDSENYIRISDHAPCDFASFISHNDGLIHYLGSGMYGHAFKLCPFENCIPEFSVKIIPYFTPSRDIDYTFLNVADSRRPENVEYLMPAYLQHILLGTHIITPHISLPVLAFQCPYKCKSIQSLMEMVKIRNPAKFEFTDNLYITEGNPILTKQNPKADVLLFVSEFARRSDVLEWIEKPGRTVLDVTILIFQLIFTFAAIQTLDDSFRHNDLSLPNLLVQEIDIPEGYENHLYHYQFLEHHFLVPIQNFSLRLWDFDFANSENVPNSKVFVETRGGDYKDEYTDYGILRQPCHQYDMHYFFTWLRKFTRFYLSLGNQPANRDLIDYIDSWTRFTGWSNSTHGNRLSSEIQNLLIPNQPACYKKIYTTCFRADKEEKVPYCLFTPMHSLAMCKIFDQFRVNKEVVLRKKDLIISHYIFK